MFFSTNLSKSTKEGRHGSLINIPCNSSARPDAADIITAPDVFHKMTDAFDVLLFRPLSRSYSQTFYCLTHAAAMYLSSAFRDDYLYSRGSRVDGSHDNKTF